jgi:hypothetical protein
MRASARKRAAGSRTAPLSGTGVVGDRAEAVLDRRRT